MNKKYEYIYNSNFEYVGKAPLQLDPLESKKQAKDIYMLPSQKATITKPNIKKGYTPIYNKEKKIWENIVDNRDKIYYKNGVKVEFNLGDEITPYMSKEQYTKQELQIQKLQQDIINLEINRKKEQYKNIVYNTHTLKASQLARDNLFKAYMLQKEDNQKSILWLNSSDENINLNIDDIKNILLNLKKRDEELYFKEAQEKLNLQSQIKNLKTSGE